jgi:hypothetical protein
VRGVVAPGKHDRGLDDEVCSEREEGDADHAQRAALTFGARAREFHTTTTLAPISIRLPRPKPASATLRGMTAATPSTATPRTFQPA